MKDIKSYNIPDIAIDFFNIKNPVECRCQAAHEVCIECDICQVGKKRATIIDYDNINQYIDHTNLNRTAQTTDIITLCDEFLKHNFKTVCVFPCYIDLVKKILPKKNISTVAGFPLGMTTILTKGTEIYEYIKLGASEIDIVLNLGSIKEHNWDAVVDEILTFIAVTGDRKIKLKIIIETCLLTDEEIIITCLFGKKFGIDFIKTSTGFAAKGAEVETVKLIRDTVGTYMGVKASGGIKTREEAINMLKAGANRIGTSNSLNIIGK